MSRIMTGHKFTAATLMLIFFGYWTLSPAFAEKLTIKIAQSNNALNITASTDQETLSHVIDAQEMTVQKLKTIYNLLDPQNNKSGTLESVNRFLKQQFNTLQKVMPQSKDDAKKRTAENQFVIPNEIKMLLEEVGQSLFTPIQPLMENATTIEFVVTEENLLFPLDALFYKGRPLFLQKPVLYRFKSKFDAYLPVSKNWKGCLISDPDTSPGKTVQGIKDYFPNSQYYNCRKLSYEDIQKVGPSDFMLISADGNPQGIVLPQFTIRSWNLSHVQPKLVFLNVDKLGLGIDFIKTFRQAGSLYYVAPIFSCETEDSSAKTMERFFRSLSNGDRPPLALYLTRKTLFDEYLSQDNDFLWLMSRVFPFRVYRLN